MSKELRKSKRTVRNPRRKKTFILSKTNVDDQLVEDSSGAVPELIKFKVPLTNLKEGRILNSNTTFLKKLPWQLCIKGSEIQNFVGFFLQSEKMFLSGKKTCKVKGLLMIHNSSDKKVFKRNFSHTFYSKRTRYGFNDFIEFDALEKKGLISGDGLVSFEAQISVEKPTENVEALTDRIYQLELENYKLKETCKGRKTIFLVFDCNENIT